MTRYSEEEWEVRRELADCYHLASRFGWTDLIYTHISARLPGTFDHFLLNPFGLFFHEVTPENLVKVSLDGTVIEPTPYGINKAGYIIHSAVHEARPEISCVIHTHTPSGMALSSLSCGLLPLTQHGCRFYDRLSYHDYEGIALDADEKARLIQDLGKNKAMILRNHGFLTAGRTIGEAFTLMFFLEKAAEAQLKAMATGVSLVIPSPEVCEKTAAQFADNPQSADDKEWQALRRLATR